jgi:hypothetical protein
MMPAAYFAPRIMSSTPEVKQSVKTSAFEAELNNNKMERLNGEIRDREKTVRDSRSPIDDYPI